MRTEERKKQLGEVFTPRHLVIDVLKKLPHEVWTDEEKTFCDPACGNGNFLVVVLELKLKLKHDPTKALSTIYGVDIMCDNVEECRERLLNLVGNTERHRRIVEKNIVCADSLQYDFSFE